MKAEIGCLLLAAVHWIGPALAQDTPNATEMPKELQGNGTVHDQNENTASDVSKFFLPPIIHEDENDDNADFYPKPHFQPLFYPFLHHHKPEHHHEKPKPPVHKPPPKPIHKPEHHKPPLVIHHKPIHKPVHIHIHKPSPHPMKPSHNEHHKPVYEDHHTPVHHDHHKPVYEEHHKPPVHHDHHKPPVHHDHHKPPVHHHQHSHYSPGYHKPPKDDCGYNCNGTSDDGIETIDLDAAEVHEFSPEEDYTKYSSDEESDESKHDSQVESSDGFDRYEVNYAEKPFNSVTIPSDQDYQSHSSSGNGVRKPVVSLADLLSDLRPVPWYSQHQEEKQPVRQPLTETHIQHSNTEYSKHPDKDHEKPCKVHHHHHYYYPVKYPEHYHPVKPYGPVNFPLAAQKEDWKASTTESTFAETVDPKISIPYYEYDVSTKATEEEKPVEEENHSQKPIRKQKPKPSYRPMSQISQLLWPFSSKPTRIKGAKKSPTHQPEPDKKKGETEEENDEEENIFSDFFEIR